VNLKERKILIRVFRLTLNGWKSGRLVVIPADSCVLNVDLSSKERENERDKIK